MSVPNALQKIVIIKVCLDVCKKTHVIRSCASIFAQTNKLNISDVEGKCYFVSIVVLTLCEKKNVLEREKNFEAEGREFPKFLFLEFSQIYYISTIIIRLKEIIRI